MLEVFTTIAGITVEFGELSQQTAVMEQKLREVLMQSRASTIGRPWRTIHPTAFRRVDAARIAHGAEWCVGWTNAAAGAADRQVPTLHGCIRAKTNAGGAGIC